MVRWVGNWACGSVTQCSRVGGWYCRLHINLQPPHPGLGLETGIYIVFDYGTSIQKYRDFEDCSSVEG